MDTVHEKILANPRFHELVARRNRFSFTLAVIVLAVYAAFVCLAVFAPGVFSASVGGGSAWALGLIVGFCIQGFAFAMTGIYTRRANGEFDQLAQAAIRGGKAA